MEIGEFIEARISDEEAAALAAIATESTRRHPSQGAWAAKVDEAGPGVELLAWLPSTEPPEVEVNVMGGKWGAIGYWDAERVGYDGEYLDAYEDVVTHIALQDPKSTVTRVLALRALVGLHVKTMWCSEGPMCDVCKVATGIGDDHEGEWPCLTLRHVASIWASHPDFDPAWQVAA